MGISVQIEFLLTSLRWLRLDVRMDGQALTIDTKQSQKDLLTALLDSSLESDLARGVARSGPEGLARRYLPPGTPTDIFHLHQSHQIACQAKAASSSTFFRTFHESGWAHVLRFRAKSQHSMCTTCHKAKSKNPGCSRDPRTCLCQRPALQTPFRSIR